jgi:hypothetical protein
MLPIDDPVSDETRDLGHTAEAMMQIICRSIRRDDGCDSAAMFALSASHGRGS